MVITGIIVIVYIYYYKILRCVNQKHLPPCNPDEETRLCNVETSGRRIVRTRGAGPVLLYSHDRFQFYRAKG